MDNCMHCLVFHPYWTKYDALVNTWQNDETGKKIEICPCIRCVVKKSYD